MIHCYVVFICAIIIITIIIVIIIVSIMHTGSDHVSDVCRNFSC